MQPDGQGSRSLANNKIVGALSRGAVLLITLNLVVDVPNCSVLGNFAFHGQLLDAHRFAVMFQDGQSRTNADSCGVRHNPDIGDWDWRWSSLR